MVVISVIGLELMIKCMPKVINVVGVQLCIYVYVYVYVCGACVIFGFSLCSS